MIVEKEVSECLEKLVEVIAASINDWSHYDWKDDCRASTSSSSAPPAPSLSSSSSLQSSESSDSSSSDAESNSPEVTAGSAAGKPGRWRKTKRTEPMAVVDQVPEIESKPSDLPEMSRWSISTEKDPLLVVDFKNKFQKPDKYLKNVKWSPDGSCWLAVANDNFVRCYNLPEFYCESKLAAGQMSCESEPAFLVNEGESIYDICWYPFMDSSYPETCL